jgi:Lon protease-like protein
LVRGNALLKLENFEMASACYEEGKYLLQASPNQEIWNQLQRGSVCATLLRNASKSLGKTDIENEFECVLCLKLFYEPATLPCGHTFCRHCVGQSTLFNNKCPLCRTVFHANFKPPVTVTLKNILEKLFPQEYKTREQEVKAEETEESMRLPLFIMGGICFPGEDFPMHVYDPRYRIMLKRVMQGCRQFGLVQVKEDSQHPEGFSIESIGCCMEVQQCETLPDGRSLIQTKAQKRFRILERSMVDGYWVAKVEFIDDVLPKDERELKLAQDLIRRVKQLVGHAITKNDGQQDLSQLEHLATSLEYSIDTPEECALFASKICTLLPISPQLKQPLLEMDSPIDRLRRIISLLERLVGSPNCNLL